MAKTPKDLPEIGDRCEWRGHGNRGRLEMVDTERDWCTVKWERGGPVLIHLFELKRIAADK